jgi:hypothetical protein
MYDGILITKLDRLTRGRDWKLREWAEQNGKKIVVASPELVWPPEPGDVAAPIIWDNLVNIASSEWDATSQRYRRMQKSLRDQGYFVGKKPYGYQIIGANCLKSSCECKDDHKTLWPEPVTGSIVKGMSKRYLEGQSLRDITDWLIASAIPAPQPPKGRQGQGWTTTAVMRILRNPAIAGRVRVKGRTVLQVEPLISMADFNRIQEMMTSRAHRGAPKETAMLTGMAFCNNGKPIYRIQGRGWAGNPNPEYYYCYDQCPKGDRLMVPLAELHKALDDAVESLADMEHVSVTVKPGDTYGEEIARIKEEIAALDPEDPDWMQQATKLQEQIKAYRLLPRKPAEITTKGDGKSVVDVWRSLDDAGKRRWLLSRRPANWLQDQSQGSLGAAIQVSGKDPETGAWITDIDLGEFTDTLLSLRTL